MNSISRLFALSLILSFTLPAVANETIGKNELDAQKELLLIKIDNNRELAQKDIDLLNKRIDDQIDRLNDLGLAANRFNTLVSVLGIAVMVLLALGGVVGYHSVSGKAKEEAISTSEKWFKDNHQKLTDRIRELEDFEEQLKLKVEEALNTIDDSVSNVTQSSVEAMKVIQERMNVFNAQNEPIITPDQEKALKHRAEQTRQKPEVDYSFEDWNTRAFSAFYDLKYEEAALYWMNASNIPNADTTLKAQALFNRIVVFIQLNLNNEVCTTCKQLIDAYSSDNAPAIRNVVAMTMLNMGTVLGRLNRLDEAIATYERLIDNYYHDNTPDIHNVVAMAMLYIGTTFGEMQKPDKAIASYKKLIDNYSSDNALAIREQVAKAMFNMGGTLRLQVQKPDEAINSYDKLIDNYSSDNTPATREVVADAMFNKGSTLEQLNKLDEAIDVYEKLIDTYSSDNTPAIREVVAEAMFKKGSTLEQLNKLDEAIDVYEKLIGNYSSDNTSAIRIAVANAMFKKGRTLGQLDKPNEAITAYEKLIDNYSFDNTHTIREMVANAMNDKGCILVKQKKPNEAIKAYENLIDNYFPDDSLAIRELVAVAFNVKGYICAMEAKKAWENRDLALTLLHRAQTDLLASLAQGADCGITYGNLAYVQWLLDDQKASEENFHTALTATKNGGKELYRNTLDDINQHTIPPDKAFRSMVERLWGEFQRGTASSPDDLQ